MTEATGSAESSATAVATGETTATTSARPAVDKKRRKGLVMVWTGKGKGKTTAAIGLTLRAAGNKMHVLFLQFVKGAWKTGERQALPLLAPYVDYQVMGKGFTIERLRNKGIVPEDHALAAQTAFAFAREAVHSKRYQMVVLDEIMATMNAGLIAKEDVLELVRSKPPMLHLVLTGRNAPPELIELADLVSEIQPVKHPYQAGIPAQRGVEF
jgi:cob(I)alamin adenosyltransferase